MKKITEIPERKIKAKQKVEILCDVCGGSVKDYWFMTSHYDGVNFEYTSPVDLCEQHQHLYEKALRILPYPFQYMEERYDGKVGEEKVLKLINLIKDLNEEEY